MGWDGWREGRIALREGQGWAQPLPPNLNSPPRLSSPTLASLTLYLLNCWLRAEMTHWCCSDIIQGKETPPYPKETIGSVPESLGSSGHHFGTAGAVGTKEFGIGLPIPMQWCQCSYTASCRRIWLLDAATTPVVKGKLVNEPTTVVAIVSQEDWWAVRKRMILLLPGPGRQPCPQLPLC